MKQKSKKFLPNIIHLNKLESFLVPRLSLGTKEREAQPRLTSVPFAYIPPSCQLPDTRRKPRNQR